MSRELLSALRITHVLKHNDASESGRTTGTLCHSAPEWLTRSTLLSFIRVLSSNYQWRTRPTSTCTKSELR